MDFGKLNATITQWLLTAVVVALQLGIALSLVWPILAWIVRWGRVCLAWGALQ